MESGALISSDAGLAIWVLILGLSALIRWRWRLRITLCAFIIAAATGPSITIGRGEVGLAGFISAFAPIPRRIEIRLEDFILIYWYLRWALDVALRRGKALDRKSVLNFFPLYIFSIFLGALVFVNKNAGGSYLPWLYFTKYLEYFLAFLYVANHVRDEKTARGLLRVTLLSAFPVGLWAIYQMVNRTTYASDGSTRAVLPFHDGPAPLSEYTLILIPLALFGAYVGKLMSPKVALFLVALLFSAMYGSSSRLAIAGILMAVSLGSLVFSRRVLLATVASVGVLVALILSFPRLFPEDLVARVTDFSTMYGTRYSSAEQRLDVWTVALDVWSGNRILGVGLTGFPVADNQYIRALVELGAFGAVVLLLCMLQFVLIGWSLYRNARLTGSKTFEAVGVSYLATLLAIFFYAVSLDAFQPIRPMNVFWFYTGLVFAASRALRQRLPVTRQVLAVPGRKTFRSPIPARTPA